MKAKYLEKKQLGLKKLKELNFYKNMLNTIIAPIIFMIFLSSVKGEEQKNSVLELKSETNELSNITWPKNNAQIKISLQNTTKEPYLWILAYGSDNRKIEHGAGSIKIEVNGVVLESEFSILQEPTYHTPVHSQNWRKKHQKYDKEKQAWRFKYDVDFIMNNQCGSSGNWGVYTTTGLNHWYLFDLKPVAKVGTNKITLTEQSDPSFWKSKFYDGFIIGNISLCSLDEGKAKIAQYNKQQIKIDPQELNFAEIMKKKYNLEIPHIDLLQHFKVTNDYITRQGKPFFMTYLNSFNSLIDREKSLNIYAYYSLVNTTMAGPGTGPTQELVNIPIYLKDGWDRYKVESWEISTLLRNISVAYNQGLLSVPYYLDNQGGLTYLEEEFPETLAHERDGNLTKGQEIGSKYCMPNYASSKFQEFNRQFYTKLGSIIREHPGVCGYSTWEEPAWRVWQPKGKMIPQSKSDLVIYRNWLNEKYKTIASLNAEWGTQYKDFSDIEFPEWKEQTANFVNFQQWRSNAALDCTKITYETLKKEDPYHFILGQKTYGDIGAGSYYWTHAIDNWMLTKYVDVSREYSIGTAMAHLGRSSSREFRKVTEANICLSQDAYRIWDKPNPWHNNLDQKALNVYPYLMSALFNENKAFHWEMYDISYGIQFHFIQYNKRWKQSVYTTWDNKPIPVEDAGSAEVVIPEKTLRISRLHQWIIRNSSLLLPAKVVTPQVAVLMSISSRMIGYDPENKLAKTTKLIPSWVDNAGQDYYLLGNLFDNMHLKFDCVDDRYIDHIFKYKVIIVGYQTNVSNQKVADKIREFVQKGGTVIFYPESMSMRDTDFHYAEKSPGFGLDKLCCANIANRKLVEKSGLKTANSTVIDRKYYGVELIPNPEAVILATDNSGKPVLVSDKKSKCYYFAGYLGLTYFQSYPQHEQYTKLFENILRKAGVECPVNLELAENTERRLVLPGLMQGKGYYLASVDNFSGKDQAMKMKVNGLIAGEYEVIDISGERPLMEKSADGNFHLKPNFAEAQPKYVSTKIDSASLKEKGLNISVPAYYSRVLLLRPSGQNVWVNSTDEAVLSYIKFKKPMKVVYGKGYKEQAEKLKEILAGKGLNVSAVTDDEVKTKVIEGCLIEDKYELEKYHHEVLDTDTDLILIGNTEENKLVKHLQTAGNYVYCKMPEMITADYPGKGRGIVQIAESVNTISYDATAKAKDAVILAGSDAKGTMNAIQKYISILNR